MIAVVDYGMGNLRSVSQAVLHVAAGTGLEVVVTSDPQQVRAAERAGARYEGTLRHGIVHGDINAVIVGQNNGFWASSAFPYNSVYPERNAPFREFTVIYHDEIGAVQAFPQWSSCRCGSSPATAPAG